MNVFSQVGHLRQDVLLLLHEGELAPVALVQAELHLRRCPLCAERLAQLRVTELQLPLAQEPLPPPRAARDRLQVELQAVSTRRHLTSTHHLHRLAEQARRLARPSLLLRAAAVLALVVVAVTFRQVTRPLQEQMGAYEDPGPEPDHTLTPGSASSLTVSEVCQKTDDNLDPPVPAELQRAVFQAYRMSSRASRAYQVDYLNNPQLGGDSSLQNLWPEPYHATVWNATAKDALEARLHGMVCSGQLDLHTAQQELASDWIGAYKKYFHTERPVQTVAALGRNREP